MIVNTEHKVKTIVTKIIIRKFIVPAKGIKTAKLSPPRLRHNKKTSVISVFFLSFLLDF